MERIMTTQTYTPADIVRFALSKDAVNIATAFDQMAGQRVADAVQARKIEIAQSMLGGQPPEEQQAEVAASDEVETETETVVDDTNTESEESNENAEQTA
jgi:hypothetical protein